MYGFLKNENVLDEVYQVEDLFDLTTEKERIKLKLDQITQPSTIGLIGDYGIGKSTILWQLERQADKDTENWFVFDAWKYPDRKELWENFIIDFAKHIAGQALEKATNAKLAKKDFKKELTKKLLKDLKIFPDSIGYLLDYLSGERISLDSYLEVLADIIENYPKNLFIVLEDIDRSGDHGKYFLETLKYFLFSHHYEKKVIFIVPVATQTYDRESCKKSYIKSLNYTMSYEPKYKDFTNFLEFIIDESLLSETNRKHRLEQFIRHFCKKNSITIRELKLILRDANQRYIELKRIEPQIDWETTICVECMKKEKTGEISTYKYSKNAKKINSDTLYAAHIYAIALGVGSIVRNERDKEVISYPNASVQIFDWNEPCNKDYLGTPYIAGDYEKKLIILSKYFV